MNNFDPLLFLQKYFMLMNPKTRSGKILRRLLRSILLKPQSIKKSDLNVISDKKIFLNIKKQIKTYE